MNPLKKLLFFFVLTASISIVCAQGDPAKTEVWTPVPPIVTPGTGTSAPSDAIVLFDGINTNEWENSKAEKIEWTVSDGALTVKAGTGIIRTKRLFGDCQLHIEWRTPAVVSGDGQGRGNSGIFLQGKYELQVLDNYENVTYSNGQAGSLYKQAIPLVNVCRKPGEWQVYDVIYKAPVFNEDGSLKTPAFITVLQNGVLVQNHYELKGSTEYIGQPTYKKHNAKEAILLQDHGNEVSYRNIWIREL